MKFVDVATRMISKRYLELIGVMKINLKIVIYS